MMPHWIVLVFWKKKVPYESEEHCILDVPCLNQLSYLQIKISVFSTDDTGYSVCCPISFLHSYAYHFVSRYHRWQGTLQVCRSSLLSGHHLFCFICAVSFVFLRNLQDPYYKQYDNLMISTKNPSSLASCTPELFMPNFLCLGSRIINLSAASHECVHAKIFWIQFPCFNKTYPWCTTSLMPGSFLHECPHDSPLHCFSCDYWEFA
jgi:hypothetical protein